MRRVAVLVLLPGLVRVARIPPRPTGYRDGHGCVGEAAFHGGRFSEPAVAPYTAARGLRRALG